MFSDDDASASSSLIIAVVVLNSLMPATRFGSISIVSIALDVLPMLLNVALLLLMMSFAMVLLVSAPSKTKRGTKNKFEFEVVAVEWN